MNIPTTNILVQVKEVVEVERFECDKLLETGEWVFLNCYFITREIAPETYTQEIKYCLGRII